MKAIQLTRGKVAIVDDEDFERIAQWRWHYGGKGYAIRVAYTPKQGGGYSRQWISMHDVVFGKENLPAGCVVDHRNCETLDNRRENLRAATVGQNKANQRRQARNKSGFKGVRFRERGGTFEAAITVNRKQRYLGRFPTAEAAHAVYCAAAKELHGEFARFN